eukprot:15442942-Alexandrium_andersonii.AAC.1
MHVVAPSWDCPAYVLMPCFLRRWALSCALVWKTASHCVQWCCGCCSSLSSYCGCGCEWVVVSSLGSSW